MELNTQQLSEIKQELQKFSSVSILKSYKLITQIYKSDIETQALIDSQITKSIVRIGQKKYTEDDEEKYAKAIKICRKLVKQWKQLILTNDQAATDEIKKNDHLKDVQRNIQKQKQIQKDDDAIIKKKVKQEPEKKEIKPIQHKNGNQINAKLQNNNSQNGIGEPVDDDKRKKAIEGLKKYFLSSTDNENVEWSKTIEQTIYDLYKQSVQNYMDKVKSVVKLIDRNAEFRQRLLNGEYDLVSEIKKLK